MTAPRGGPAALEAAKAAAGGTFRIPVGAPPCALLRPVATAAGRLDPADVRRLTEWRNRHVGAFLTGFEATEERTARWLTGTVGPNGTRILFMVDDATGRTFAYMGLAFIAWEDRSGEVDAVVRGAEAPPGTMTRALHALVGWARTALGLATIGVRVRSDNPALDFYCKAGFREIRRVALRRIEEERETRWVEDTGASAGGVALVHMRLQEGPS